MIPEELVPLFFVVFAIFGLGSWYFYQHASVANKRKWHPWMVASPGVLLLAFVVWGFPTVEILALVVPCTIFILWLNYKNTQFCDSCGTILNAYENWFTKQSYCHECGANLKTEACQEGLPAHSSGSTSEVTNRLRFGLVSIVVGVIFLVFWHLASTDILRSP
ncbi:MAG: hypothetical protein V3R80_04845 [Candidatus Tectomicrobia bacterium]